MEIFIDSVNGNSANDGSIQRPLTNLIDVFNLNLIDDKIVINLLPGNYILTEAFCQNLYSKSISNMKIIGDGINTVITIESIYPNATDGTYNVELNICKCIVDIRGTSSNLIAFKSKVKFYNVLFRNIPHNEYSVFCPHTPCDIYMYNCIKLNKSNAFIRSTHGNVYVYNSYGAFTSGYSTTDNQWNKENNIITYNVKLDDKYKIIDSVNDTIGLYSGEHPWINSLYLISKNGNYYGIADSNYDLNNKNYNNLTINVAIYELFKDNSFKLQQLFNETTIGDETFMPIDKFDNFHITKLLK